VSEENDGIQFIYAVDASVTVDQTGDRLRIKMCKVYGNQNCQQKEFFISPGINTVLLEDSFLVGKWEFTLYHAKPGYMSLPSSKIVVDRGEIKCFIQQMNPEVSFNVCVRTQP